MMNAGAAQADEVSTFSVVPFSIIESNSALNTFSLVNGMGYALLNDGV